MAELDTITGMAPGVLESAGVLIGGAEEEAKKARSESQKASQSKLMADYGSTMFSKPAPHFEPSNEDMSGFAALGSLLAVSGAMMGMKGKSSGIMAMNAISGMMGGYQQGRKDLYEQERSKFEMSMKDWERERGQIKEAFDMAMKMAPTNYKGAVEFLNKTLTSLGVEVPKASLERNGLTQTASSFGAALDKAGTTAKNIATVTSGGPKITKEQAQKFGIPELEGMTFNQAKTQIKALEARKAAEEKSMGTGALEYGDIGGRKGMYTREQILQAQKGGQEFVPLAKPTSRTTKIQFEGKTVLADESGKPLRDPEGNVIAAPETSKGVAQQQQNQRIINGTAGAVSSLEAIKDIKGGTTTGILPFLGDKEGMLSFLKTAAGRALTDDDAKILDVYYTGLARNIAAIEASGSATGLVGLTKTFEQLKPMVGDSNYVVAAKLADARRVIEETVQSTIDSGILTKDQSATASGLISRLKNAIPYTVSDVNKALSTTSDEGAGTIGSETQKVVKPSAVPIDTFENFLSYTRTRRDFDGYSDEELRTYYNQKFGNK